VTYPRVLGEFETIRKVASGFSLARFGDGELKMVYGMGYSREQPSPEIAQELGKILLEPHDKCLPAIPTMDAHGPKFWNWTRHMARFEEVLDQDRVYYSAFVSRPDSAPWINTREFAEILASVWKDKRVAVVCERKGSMFSTVNLHARQTTHIECPRSGAYGVIDELEQAVVDLDPDVAILAAGPTATCLANRLAARGIQAVDLGSAGGFLGKLLK
jgi:glycosyltransferase GT-like protein